MARYTGPREKIARRFGIALFGPSKALELRNFPPDSTVFAMLAARFLNTA